MKSCRNAPELRVEKKGRKIPSPKRIFLLSGRFIKLKTASFRWYLFYLAVPMVLAILTLTISTKPFPTQQEVAETRSELQGKIQAGGEFLERGLKSIFTKGETQESRDAVDIVEEILHHGVRNLPIPVGLMLMFVMTALFIGVLTSCLEISTEQTIYLRERRSCYGNLEYFLSKVPFLLLLASAQCGLFLIICSLNPDIGELPLLAVWGVMVGVAIPSIVMGLLVSAMDPTQGQLSITMAIILVLPQFLLSGAIGADFYAGMGDGARLAANILPAKWGMESLFTVVYDRPDLAYMEWIRGVVQDVVGFDYGSSALNRSRFAWGVQTIVATFLCILMLRRKRES